MTSAGLGRCWKVTLQRCAAKKNSAHADGGTSEWSSVRRQWARTPIGVSGNLNSVLIKRWNVQLVDELCWLFGNVPSHWVCMQKDFKEHNLNLILNCSLSKLYSPYFPSLHLHLFQTWKPAAYKMTPLTARMDITINTFTPLCNLQTWISI